MKDMKKRYVEVYKQAENFLQKMAPTGINLEKYYIADKKAYKSLDDIFVQFIDSAQNYQRMPNVIAFNARRKEVGKILHDFDHKKVSSMDPENLYRLLRDKFDVKSADTKQNSWRKWSNAIVDAARFLSEFKDTADFDEFVNRFDYNVHTSMALPRLISHKINGIGFALACNLLKELGYSRYPKPDVHLMDVFSGLGLCEKDQIATFEAVVRMSDYCMEAGDKTATPYKVDKIFWLICSGNFHLEEPKGILVKGQKKEFIEMMLNKESYS